MVRRRSDSYCIPRALLLFLQRWRRPVVDAEAGIPRRPSPGLQALPRWVLVEWRLSFSVRVLFVSSSETEPACCRHRATSTLVPALLSLRRTALTPSRSSALATSFRKHPFAFFGLPFLATMVIASFGLSKLTQTRYDLRDEKVHAVSREEELGMKKGRRKFDVREEYFVRFRFLAAGVRELMGWEVEAAGDGRSVGGVGHV